MTIIRTTKELRPRDENDFYPTPIKLCRAALELVPWQQPIGILDPGAGAGPWGAAARERWPRAPIHGVELRYVDMPNGYTDWWCGWDYRLWEPDPGLAYDLVIGNPPYKYAEEFARRALMHVKQFGMVLFLYRLAFLESQTRGRGLWREAPPWSVHILVDRVSFTGNGKTDNTAYALYLWRKGWTGETTLKWLDWNV